ncbi:MAG: methyltransferase domain-containing protein [Euryarchaeota archaeon]|nr:methyltransferase domain-containing protein [Euryarchaeota archaeon]
MVATCDYVPTSEARAREMLSLAGVKEGEVVYDLGCGTGEILIVAAEEFGARCFGIEVNSRLVAWAREEVERRGLEDRVRILHGNIFDPRFWLHLGGDPDIAVANADVVTCYLTLWVQEELRPLIERELAQGARVVSREFRLASWKPVKVKRGIYLFEKGRSF